MQLYASPEVEVAMRLYEIDMRLSEILFLTILENCIKIGRRWYPHNVDVIRDQHERSLFREI